MAVVEFDEYALHWWEQVLIQQEENGEPSLATWADMKHQRRTRFVPTHSKRDQFDKLQHMKQGARTVEEYYKDMEQAMI